MYCEYGTVSIVKVYTYVTTWEEYNRLRFLFIARYYSLALALAQAERFDDAVGEFKHASQVLQMKIGNGCHVDRHGQTKRQTDRDRKVGNYVGRENR